MYDRILLPTDGSVGMAKAIELCFHHAQQDNATVHTVYVVDVRAYMMLPDETKMRVRELLHDEGKDAINYLEQRAEEMGITIISNLMEGVPHEAILSYANEHEIDLIVMGTHGRSGEQRRILGSVAEEVVRNADVPVLTVKMTEEELKRFGDTIPEAQQRYIA